LPVTAVQQRMQAENRALSRRPDGAETAAPETEMPAPSINTSKREYVAENVMPQGYMPWADSIAVPAVVLVEEATAGRHKRLPDVYPAAYIGAGTAFKLSSLLNNKTLHSLERSSLVSASPGWQQDLFLLYGTRLRDRLHLQADLYLHNKAAQQYYEYREGTYAGFRDELSYQSLGLSASWIRRQAGYGRYPVYVRWTGGLYGGRLLSAEESSVLGVFDKTAEYSRFHAGLMAGYEYDVFLHEQLIFSYGLRARSDMLNIYSGMDDIPSSFRRTKVVSLELMLALKFGFRK
jgi:hypothetical protein